MTRIVSTTPGLYPLPDWAKSDLKDLKGNQKEDLISGDEGEDLAAAYAEVRGDVVEWQAEAGLDYVVEGQGRWDDMLAHPLTVNDAVETRGIVRYYNNNNFYRDPVVHGDLRADGDVAAELEAASDLVDEGLQAVLPGPYSLADLATDEHYGDEADFLAAIADFLAAEAEGFPDVESLFLLEPSLVEGPPAEGEHERVSEAIDTVAGAVNADVVVHTYFGAVDETTYAHVLDADFEGFGYDLVSAADENVHLAGEYGSPDQAALGVVDGQNTRVESAETVRERLDWFQERTQANDYETLYATTNTEPFYLPVNRFREKLRALGAATQVEVTA